MLQIIITLCCIVMHIIREGALCLNFCILHVSIAVDVDAAVKCITLDSLLVQYDYYTDADSCTCNETIGISQFLYRE